MAPKKQASKEHEQKKGVCAKTKTKKKHEPKKGVCAKKPAAEPKKRTVIVDGVEIDWTWRGDMDPDEIYDPDEDADDSSN